MGVFVAEGKDFKYGNQEMLAWPLLRISCIKKKSAPR
jgi:hypothetical protein